MECIAIFNDIEGLSNINYNMWQGAEWISHISQIPSKEDWQANRKSYLNSRSNSTLRLQMAFLEGNALISIDLSGFCSRLRIQLNTLEIY